MAVPLSTRRVACGKGPAARELALPRGSACKLMGRLRGGRVGSAWGGEGREWGKDPRRGAV